VTNTPGPTTTVTADLALGLLLSATRNLAQGDAYVKAGLWAQNGDDPLKFWGNNPQHKTIGIIGYGTFYLLWGLMYATLGSGISARHWQKEFCH